MKDFKYFFVPFISSFIFPCVQTKRASVCARGVFMKKSCNNKQERSETKIKKIVKVTSFHSLRSLSQSQRYKNVQMNRSFHSGRNWVCVGCTASSSSSSAVLNSWKSIQKAHTRKKKKTARSWNVFCLRFFKLYPILDAMIHRRPLWGWWLCAHTSIDDCR